MHILIVNYVYSPELSTPVHLLSTYFGLKGWVDGLIAAGVEVTVFQRFKQDDELCSGRAEYHFISDDLRPAINRHQIPFRLHKKISKFIAELDSSENDIVLHINGLLFPLQTLHLQLTVSRKYGFIVQHHAENPMRHVSRIVQTIGLRFVDGFMFSTLDHVKDWKQAGIINNGHIIGDIMETSSILKYEDRSSARKRTGLTGNPILLWTGNLDQNKDPLTILEGLKTVLEVNPDARLYMAYRSDDLLSEVTDYIRSSESLERSVRLLGCIPYSEIQSFYNSADFFVQGSHKEGSGIALLDALACGVIPVVTDIPSFREITDNGHIGALWPVGDSQALANAILSLLNYPLDQQSIRARKRFEENFSFIRLGEKASEYYAKIIRYKSHHL